MIHRLYSTLSSFKNLRFREGLNVVLAEKTADASERQTRNRAGKSSIVEIIHFLLGGKVDPKSVFKEECLQDVAFGIEFDLAEHSVTLERQVSEEHRRNLQVAQGDYARWPIQPSDDKKTGQLVISNTSWKSVLGTLMFELPDTQRSFGPTFRSLIAYFVRRQSVGGFSSPFRQNEKQHLADEQVNASFLLGLDWTISQDWQQVREKEKTLKALNAAAREGVLGDILSTTSELRTRLAISEDQSLKLKRSLADFKVLPEYRNLEQEASDLTREISNLNDENTIDRQLISELTESLEQETPPSDHRLERVYEEAGVALPNVALEQFDRVRTFHNSVVANRRSYLEAEISLAQQRVGRREAAIAQREQRRATVMNILRSHGALDHFAQLQKELTRLESEVEHLRQRYVTAERLETGKTDLDLERQQLLLRLRRDYQEQSDVLRKVILAFEEVSEALYEVAGNLVIDAGLNGPQFDVKIQGKRSGGISNMQIFCFDMMLMKLCAERGIGPGFLFHDSHLFDGVDERQVAKALHIGAENAERFGFQYIVTLNQDAVPSELPPGFDIHEYVVPTHLTDAKEDGGLFGIRFG